MPCLCIHDGKRILYSTSNSNARASEFVCVDTASRCPDPLVGAQSKCRKFFLAHTTKACLHGSNATRRVIFCQDLTTTIQNVMRWHERHELSETGLKLRRLEGIRWRFQSCQHVWGLVSEVVLGEKPPVQDFIKLCMSTL